MAEILKAKLITQTFVNSRGGNGEKYRWECPHCKIDPIKGECRFNLDRTKINIDWTCRFCKNKIRLEK